MVIPEQQAFLIADLSYGDAGKGSIVDYLARTFQAHTVVRYNGGAQAAHNVVNQDGMHHTFSQFGSGTFVPGTRTHLSRFMMVDPLSMLKEEHHLYSLGVKDACQRTSIEGEALIITPFQQSANRLRELARAENRHGSCGMGIGETMSDFLIYGSQVLFAGDLPHRDTVRRKLRFLRDLKLGQLEEVQGSLPKSEQVSTELATLHDEEVIELCVDLYQHFAGLVAIVPDSYLGELLALPGTVIFEGAQGILLDEWYGFHPYTTWSTTTFKYAEQLLSEQEYAEDVTRIGVMRAYSTRHGPGPFVTEDEQLSIAIPDIHNGTNLWQRQFRVGHLDLVATRYALEVAGKVDYLAVTNVDRLAQVPTWQVCDAYRMDAPGEDTLDAYFGMQGANITHITVQRPPDLVHQEQLTHLLEHCRPVYHTVAAPNASNASTDEDIECYLASIEQSTGCPVALASFGPSAENKRVVSSSWVSRSAHQPVSKQIENAGLGNQWGDENNARKPTYMRSGRPHLQLLGERVGMSQSTTGPTAEPAELPDGDIGLAAR